MVMEFSADASLLLVGNQNGSINIYDLNESVLLRELKINGRVTALAIS